MNKIKNLINSFITYFNIINVNQLFKIIFFHYLKNNFNENNIKVKIN